MWTFAVGGSVKLSPSREVQMRQVKASSGRVQRLALAIVVSRLTATELRSELRDSRDDYYRKLLRDELKRRRMN